MKELEALEKKKKELENSFHSMDIQSLRDLAKKKFIEVDKELMRTVDVSLGNISVAKWLKELQEKLAEYPDWKVQNFDYYRSRIRLVKTEKVSKKKLATELARRETYHLDQKIKKMKRFKELQEKYG